MVIDIVNHGQIWSSVSLIVNHVKAWPIIVTNVEQGHKIQCQKGQTWSKWLSIMTWLTIVNIVNQCK